MCTSTYICIWKGKANSSGVILKKKKIEKNYYKWVTCFTDKDKDGLKSFNLKIYISFFFFYYLRKLWNRKINERKF